MPANSPSDLRTVRPIIANGKLKLKDVETDSACGFRGDKDATLAIMAQLKSRLSELQQRLYAEHKHKVLVVLQAMDTGGKDGVIRNVFSGINPQGIRVHGFKAPTPRELDHDYLWRVHSEVPGKGEIGVFNRSHYEDVLVTRVHGWIDDKTAKRRFRQINDFEAMLIEEGTTLLKFFLHISKDEQKRRLEDRLNDEAKQWKFNPGDLEERKRWNDYMAAYEAALNATSTPHAPWHVVPADHKWIRDLYVAAVLVQQLEALDLRYPDAPPGLEKVRVS